MKVGRYKALVKDKVISENSKGNEQAEILVEVDFGEGVTKPMKYFGQLTGGAIEHTLKALVACGIQSNNIMAAITVDKEISVVIDEEIDDKGERFFKISWINKTIGLSQPINADKGRHVAQKYAQQLGVLLAKEKKQDASFSEPPPFNEGDDLPF